MYTTLELETLRESVTEILEELDNFSDLELMEEMSGVGYCAACGESQDSVEPDAQGYECNSCGEPKVVGFELAVLLTQ